MHRSAWLPQSAGPSFGKLALQPPDQKCLIAHLALCQLEHAGKVFDLLTLLQDRRRSAFPNITLLPQVGETSRGELGEVHGFTT